MSAFARVLVGVDGTDFGFEALRQALALAPEESAVLAVTALDKTGVVQTGWDSTRFAALLAEDAENARARAAEIIGGRAGGTAKVVTGSAKVVLRHVRDEFDPTLLALGGRGRSRFLGALLGETASTLLHDATCSVLLARPQFGRRWQPNRVVVGVDGSVPSLAALAVAGELAERLGSALQVVAATGGKQIDRSGQWPARVTEWDSGSPVDALVIRSAMADLVVIGSRGLHGVKALGSVSERVAHGARCSVLIVHTR